MSRFTSTNAVASWRLSLGFIVTSEAHVGTKFARSISNEHPDNEAASYNAVSRLHLLQETIMVCFDVPQRCCLLWCLRCTGVRGVQPNQINPHGHSAAVAGVGPERASRHKHVDMLTCCRSAFLNVTVCQGTSCGAHTSPSRGTAACASHAPQHPAWSPNRIIQRVAFVTGSHL
jgi:hypothetical protein